MTKMAMFLVMALGGVYAFGDAAPGAPTDGHDQAATRKTSAGSVTRLMAKDLADVPGKEGLVEIVDFAPGEASQIHRHNSDLFVYVMEGSVITQVKGGPVATLHAGEVFYESPTDIHVVSRNASDTQPAKLLVFYVKLKGAPPTVLLKNDGTR
jgi:quercetin dioxygenase-like cupin family protein